MKMVEQIEAKQKIIDHAKAVINAIKNEKQYFGEYLKKLDRDCERVLLGDICVFEYGHPLKEENRKGGKYPVFGSNGIIGYHNRYLVKGPFIIIGRKGTAGAVVYSDMNGFPIDTTFYVKVLNNKKVLLKFLYYILGTLRLDKLNTQSGVPGLNRNDAYKINFLLPSIDIQKKKNLSKKLKKTKKLLLKTKR